MDVAPGDVYWRYDGVEFSLGRDWEVMVGDVDDDFCTVTVRRTNCLGQAIDRELEAMDQRGSVFVVRDSLLYSIEACQQRINDRLAESKDAL